MHATDSATGAISGATPPEVLAEVTENLLALSRHLMRETGPGLLETLEREGLSMSQLKILQQLTRCEAGMSLGRVAEAIGLSPAAVSRCVDALVAQELATREPDPEDRRHRCVMATRKGRAVSGRVGEIRVAAIRRFTDRLGPDELGALAAGLRPLFESDGPLGSRPATGRSARA